MVKLTLQSEPFWLTLPEFTDLRLKVRPLTTAIFAMARAKAHRTITDLGTHLRAVRNAGGTNTVPFNPDDPVSIEVFLDVEMIKELARAAIVEWNGVFDAEDAQAPVNDRTVGELVSIFPIGHRFRDAYLIADMMGNAEKNGWPPGPNGTTVMAPDIAGAAGTPASPAPVAA
ncbi:MAG: hypothetical protein HQL37_14535 [Alphaproteobacteria bacterium]|nr:hypothetical protein [Alphaproteobacteria bacterium]